MYHKGISSKGASSFRQYRQNYSEAMQQGNSMRTGESRGREKTGSSEGRRTRRNRGRKTSVTRHRFIGKDPVLHETSIHIHKLNKWKPERSRSCKKTRLHSKVSSKIMPYLGKSKGCFLKKVRFDGNRARRMDHPYRLDHDEAAVHSISSPATYTR